MYQHALKILLVIGLSACSEPNGNAPTAKPTPVEKTPATAINTTVSSPKQPTQQPMNLTLPDQQGTLPAANEHYSSKNTLPNLFNAQPKDRNLSLSGKLLQDETSPDYVDSINGAEISIEVKTK